jgi:hypothetical protein
MQRVSCELADQIVSYAENVDCFIATTDEMVKKFSSLFLGPNELGSYESNHRSSNIPVLWRRIVR